MNDNWKEVPFEILPNGGLCLVMPAEPEPEVKQVIFVPRVKIVSDFVFASAEMAKQFGGDGIKA